MLNTPKLRISRNTLLLITVLVSLVLHPIPAQALGDGEQIPDFGQFSNSVRNDQPGVLRGVYVPNILAFPVVQQPAGEPGYVSRGDGELTQFGMPSQFGNIGLLAHNNLSGRYFSKLDYGQEVRLVYGDGKVEYYTITQILRFQALEPESPYSSFRSLDGKESLSATQLFNKVYRGDRHVTFQTCIEGNGNLSWGRLFVIATPKPAYPEHGRFDQQLPR